ncbi:hypothetical protein [Gynuella sunshinyii]|uniref:hypothetical protein n=1 Tax=Gynuella sunshinyii TaxID=1445505 RepID=UPI0005CC409D|nr:hypothetical protein [Gynuella sunshinyii]
MIGIYRVSLALSALILVCGAAFVVAQLISLTPDVGNGGAFLATLSLGVGLVALVFATPLAWLAAGVSFVMQEDMPKGLVYHYLVPVAVAAPGTLLLVAAAWASI